MKKIGTFLILLHAILIMHAAKAVEFDVGFGVNKYINDKPGLWYVEPFESDMRMVAPALNIGITQNILDNDNWGLDARLGFVYLGSVKTYGEAPSRKTNTTQGAFVGPDFIGANTANPCYGPCTNISRFYGSGSDRGVTLTLEPYFKKNDWKYSLIIGGYYHKSTWAVQAVNLDGPDENVRYEQGWNLGYTAGLAVSKGNITVRYQFFRLPPVQSTDGSDFYPPAFGSSHLLTIGIKF